MARRRKSESGGSLDSLMDTMANVVGILVILLIVTQLGVSQAVERMASVTEQLPPVDEQALEEARRRAEQLRQLLHELNRDADPLPRQIQVNTMSLEEVKKLIEQLQAEAAEVMDDRGKVDELERELERRRAKAEELQSKAAESQAEISRLRALLDDTPMPEAPPPTVITMPNPRSPERGSTPVYFIVKDGRITDLPLQRIRERVQTEFERRVQAAEQLPTTLTCDRFLELFNRPIGNLDARYDVQVTLPEENRWVLTISRKEDVGETLADLESGGTRYAREIQQARQSSNPHYARFYVWGDSNDVYLKAREMVDQIGLPAGWEPRWADHHARFTSRLRGTYACEGMPDPRAPRGDGPSSPQPTRRTRDVLN